jgi:hypothetical protein
MKANIYLGTKSTSVSGAESTKNSAHHNTSDRLVQRQTEIGTKDTNWESSNMASERPPQKEHIDDGRWFLVFFVDPINTLRLNAHLLIQPFLTTAHLSQETSLLLKLSGPDDLLRVGIMRTVVCDDRFTFELRIRTSRFNIAGMPHVGLVAMNEVGHPENDAI